MKRRDSSKRLERVKGRMRSIRCRLRHLCCSNLLRNISSKDQITLSHTHTVSKGVPLFLSQPIAIIVNNYSPSFPVSPNSSYVSLIRLVLGFKCVQLSCYCRSLGWSIRHHHHIHSLWPIARLEISLFFLTIF